MKVRDELKVTTAAYKALYESSVVFGIRKQVQAEEGVKDMENKIKELERKKKIQENYKIELTNVNYIYQTQTIIFKPVCIWYKISIMNYIFRSTILLS